MTFVFDRRFVLYLIILSVFPSTNFLLRIATTYLKCALIVLGYS